MKLKVKAEFLKLFEFEEIPENREAIMKLLEAAALNVNHISEQLKAMLSLVPKEENEESIQLLKDLLDETEKWHPEQQFYHLLHSHLAFLMDMLSIKLVNGYQELQTFCQNFLKRISTPEYTTIIRVKFDWYLPQHESSSLNLLAKYENLLVQKVILPFVDNFINAWIQKISSYLKCPLFICSNEEVDDIRKLARSIEDELDSLLDLENFELSRDSLEAIIDEIQGVIVSVERILDTNRGLPFSAESTDDPLSKLAGVNPLFRELEDLIGIYSAIHTKGDISRRINVLSKILSDYEQRGSTDAIEGNVEWVRGLKILRSKLDEVSFDLFRGKELSSRESLEKMSLNLQELARRLNNLEKLKILPELKIESLNLIVKAMKANERNCLELQIEDSSLNSLMNKIGEFIEDAQTNREYLDALKNYLANLKLLKTLSLTKASLGENFSNPISSSSELEVAENLLQHKLQALKEVSPITYLDLRLEIYSRKQKELLKALLKHIQKFSNLLNSLSSNENVLETCLAEISYLRNISNTDVSETGVLSLKVFESLNDVLGLLETFIEKYLKIVKRFQSKKQGLDNNLSEYFSIVSLAQKWIPTHRLSEFNAKVNGFLRLAIQITLVKVSNLIDSQALKNLNEYIQKLSSLESILADFIQQQSNSNLYNIQAVQKILPILKKYAMSLQIEASLDDAQEILALVQNSKSLSEHLSSKKSTLDMLQNSLSADFAKLKEIYSSRLFIELLTNLELSIELTLNNANAIYTNKILKITGTVKDQLFRLMGVRTQTGKSLEPALVQQIIGIAEIATIPKFKFSSYSNTQKISIISFYKTNAGNFLLGVKISFYDNAPFKKILLKLDAITQKAELCRDTFESNIVDETLTEIKLFDGTIN